MKTRLTFLAAVAVTSLLVAPLGSQSAEQQDRPLEMQRCQALATSPCFFFGPLVLDAPFTANVLTTWTPPASTGRPRVQSSSRYYRDRGGRVRVEQLVSPNGAEQIILSTGQGVYDLLPASRTFSQSGRGHAEMVAPNGATGHFVLAVAPRVFWSFWRLPGVTAFNANEESLGDTVIGGLRVFGTRHTGAIGSGTIGSPKEFILMDERWVSDKLKLVVYARGEDSYYGVFEYKVTDVTLTDPRPELFVVPAEYVERPLTGPWTWRNPYRELSRSQGVVPRPRPN